MLGIVTAAFGVVERDEEDEQDTPSLKNSLMRFTQILAAAEYPALQLLTALAVVWISSYASRYVSYYFLLLSSLIDRLGYASSDVHELADSSDSTRVSCQESFLGC
jgi:hypothetical protein